MSMLIFSCLSPNPTVAACPPDYDNGPPVPYAGNAQWANIGCYTEATNSRALTGSSYTSNTDMTGETCLAFCAGYTYAGVEYAQEVSNSFRIAAIICQMKSETQLLTEMQCYCGNSKYTLKLWFERGVG